MGSWATGPFVIRPSEDPVSLASHGFGTKDDRNLPPSSVGARARRLLLARALGGLGMASYRGEYKGERRAADRTPFLPHSFFTFHSTRHTIIGRKDVLAEQLLERAIANGYRQGAHQAKTA